MTLHKRYRLFPSVRFTNLLLGVSGMMIMTISNSNMGFALVCMVNITDPKDKYSVFGNQSVSECANAENQSKSSYTGTLNWSKAQQANILAAYSWGALWLAIPTGWFLDKYGVKSIFAFTNAICAVTTLFTPLATIKGGPWAVFVLRIFQGLFGSFQVPAFMAMVSKWSAKEESGTFLGIGMTGPPLGNLLIMFTSGLLCASSWGWRSIFYIYTVVITGWVCLWLFLFMDDPAKGRFISSAELAYIKSQRLSKVDLTQERKNHTRPKVPWRKLLSSPAVLAVYVAQFCGSWSAFFMPAYLPTYLQEVLFIGLQANGFLSSLPYLTQALGRLVSGPASDKLKLHSPSWNVKFWNSLCLCGPMICYVVIANITCHMGAFAIALFSISQFFLSFSAAGFRKSSIFIAPRYSGVIGSVAQIPSFLASIVMAYLTGFITRNGTIEEWRTALYLGAGVSATGLVFFLIFGSGEAQPWDQEVRSDPEPSRVYPKAERRGAKEVKFY